MPGGVGLQVRREHEPPEPQPGRERLRGRAAVDDDVGREPLQRADRLAVVAELGVVVVLEHERARAPRPRDQRGAPLGGEDGAGRELVRGGDEGGVDASPAPSTRMPCSSTSSGTGSRPACSSDAGSRGQHGSSIATRLTPRSRSSRQTNGRLGPSPAVTRTSSGVALHAAPARQRRGERGPQLRLAAGVGVAEPRVGRRAQRAVERPAPGGAERAVERGQGGAQVVARGAQVARPSSRRARRAPAWCGRRTSRRRGG